MSRYFGMYMRFSRRLKRGLSATGSTSPQVINGPEAGLGFALVGSGENVPVPLSVLCRKSAEDPDADHWDMRSVYGDLELREAVENAIIHGKLKAEHKKLLKKGLWGSLEKLTSEDPEEGRWFRTVAFEVFDANGSPEWFEALCSAIEIATPAPNSKAYIELGWHIEQAVEAGIEAARTRHLEGDNEGAGAYKLRIELLLEVCSRKDAHWGGSCSKTYVEWASWMQNELAYRLGF